MKQVEKRFTLRGGDAALWSAAACRRFPKHQRKRGQASALALQETLIAAAERHHR